MKHLKLYEEHTNNSSEMVSIKKETLELFIMSFGYDSGNIDRLDYIDETARLFKYWGLEHFQEYKDAYSDINIADDLSGYTDDYIYSDIRDEVILYAGISKICRKMGFDPDELSRHIIDAHSEVIELNELLSDVIIDKFNKFSEYNRTIQTIEDAERAIILYEYYENDISGDEIYWKLIKYKPESIKHLLDLEILNQDDLSRLQNAEKHKDIINL